MLFKHFCAASLVLVAIATPAHATVAPSITLNGTVRDFMPGTLSPGTTNPDFEANIGGLQTGLVQSTLTGNSPIYTGSGGSIDSAASFNEWYGSAAPNINYSITLNETSPGIYSYSNSNFFPIDNQLLGNYPNSPHNYHFTYQISALFGYTPGDNQTFTFSGDDDVWVFFDKKLGIDLGGIHPAVSQTVNLDTLFGPGKAAGNYAFDFFFAERHTVGSNLDIQTSLVLVPSVPEPETYSLMLVGLGIIGFFTQRKKNSVS